MILVYLSVFHYDQYISPFLNIIFQPSKEKTPLLSQEIILPSYTHDLNNMDSNIDDDRGLEKSYQTVKTTFPSSSYEYEAIPFSIIPTNITELNQVFNIITQTDRLDRIVEGFRTKSTFSSKTEIQKETINQMIEEYHELEKNGIKYRNDDHREFKRYLDEKTPDKRAEFLKAYFETSKINQQLERENFKKAVDVRKQIMKILSDG